MKATLEVPDDLYQRVEAKSAQEGRAVSEVAVELFEHYVGAEAPSTAEQEAPPLPDGKPLPPWFGILEKYARKVDQHDMESIRRSIAAGIAKEHGL